MRIVMVLVFIFPTLDGETRTGTASRFVDLPKGAQAEELLGTCEHQALQVLRSPRVIKARCALEMPV